MTNFRTRSVRDKIFRPGLPEERVTGRAREWRAPRPNLNTRASAGRQLRLPEMSGRSIFSSSGRFSSGVRTAFFEHRSSLAMLAGGAAAAISIGSGSVENGNLIHQLAPLLSFLLPFGAVFFAAPGGAGGNEDPMRRAELSDAINMMFGHSPSAQEALLESTGSSPGQLGALPEAPMFDAVLSYFDRLDSSFISFVNPFTKGRSVSFNELLEEEDVEETAERVHFFISAVESSRALKKGLSLADATFEDRYDLLQRGLVLYISAIQYIYIGRSVLKRITDEVVRSNPTDTPLAVLKSKYLVLGRYFKMIDTACKRIYGAKELPENFDLGAVGRMIALVDILQKNAWLYNAISRKVEPGIGQMVEEAKKIYHILPLIKKELSFLHDDADEDIRQQISDSLNIGNFMKALALIYSHLEKTLVPFEQLGRQTGSLDGVGAAMARLGITAKTTLRAAGVIDHIRQRRWLRDALAGTPAFRWTELSARALDGLKIHANFQKESSELPINMIARGPTIAPNDKDMSMASAQAAPSDAVMELENFHVELYRQVETLFFFAAHRRPSAAEAEALGFKIRSIPKYLLMLLSELWKNERSKDMAVQLLIAGNIWPVKPEKETIEEGVDFETTVDMETLFAPPKNEVSIDQIYPSFRRDYQQTNGHLPDQAEIDGINTSLATLPSFIITMLTDMLARFPNGRGTEIISEEALMAIEPEIKTRQKIGLLNFFLAQ